VKIQMLCSLLDPVLCPIEGNDFKSWISRQIQSHISLIAWSMKHTSKMVPVVANKSLATVSLCVIAQDSPKKQFFRPNS
jgi:hypothetical protein